jgi:thioester reductase-like protein
MALFLTGATGYIGSYIADGILRNHADRLAVLVRAKSIDEAEKRLWKSLQLHMDAVTFHAYLNDRIEIFLGDLTMENLGLEPDARERLIHSTDSVIHCAASLNRKSEKSCLNVNLRGTLQVIKVARAAQDHHGLRRFSDISTVAVAGRRQDEVVTEDRSIEWDRSDYDPYARTKKFCEHMVEELLPEVSRLVFRPSIVLGDSRFPETTQFDMVRSFVFLAQLPLLPFESTSKLDIVPADYVSRAIVQIHQSEKPKYGIYHLSSGTGALSYNQILSAMHASGFQRSHLLVPGLLKPFSWVTDAIAATPRSWGLSLPASAMKVFLPYLTFNTVFDNSRVREELGCAPKPFSEYALPLFRFAKENRFTYPYKPWVEKKEARVA